MLLARLQFMRGLPKFWTNSVIITGAVLSSIYLTGCASKPQYSTTTRYAAAPDRYVVRSGDTLSAISSRYGLDYIKVAQMNDIASPYRIYVGQTLRLKGNVRNDRITTQPLNTNAGQIQRQQVVVPNTTNTNTNTTTATVQPNRSAIRWIRPTTGAVIENFNAAKDIKGIRYGGNVGDPVYAAADGQVVYAADGLPEYGRLVLIKHNGGYISAYAHNSKLLVKSGENVVAGKKIAEMGSTGTNRVMLEFQIRLDGKPTDPVNLLPSN
ncbi:peptidoglycan DD-metalloendopeptidase family protein [Acinetobacter rudis]|uniref:peptidoglycan DD-metalloendopeptidase family protein n=1 Tax=Acinetobacter rudis TaxID=632955 RepID=UPI0028108C56|nr:peptidoglycan DD-metalloendopeptidase family protein [Acinetobacter rudis]MDQ8951847.1 peptidoglycan DD-metalloendopeptidase family protein [Acinetobacter rudis]